MKKIICLLLCLSFLICMLVSCKDDEIGADLDELRDKVQIEEVKEIELDFYVIVGEGTTQNATNTVELMINQHLEGMKTSLDMHYISADEYAAKMMNDIALDGDDKADIVLVTSKDMFDSLYDQHLIANITEYFDPVKSPYRSLNTQICKALLSASTVPEDAINNAGSIYVKNNNYCVPNNHVVSAYSIVLINREISEYYGVGQLTASQMVTEELCKPLYDMIDADPNATYTREQAVVITTGSYADVCAYKADGRYIVNTLVPTVTAEEAYSSAFAIARHPRDRRFELDLGAEELPADVKEYSDYYNRCMQVIYELNTNADLRNLLLYGKLNTNYKVDAETGYVTHDDIAADDVYVMDILYTGDAFKAYFCECDKHSWTKDDALYGETQNKDAILYVAPEADTPDDSTDGGSTDVNE